MAKRVLVCGGREYSNQSKVNQTLRKIYNSFAGTMIIIQGGAGGADYQAKIWAIMNDIPCETYEADWKNLGKSAGPIRNNRMLEEGKPDLVVAFPGGRGTANMVKIAKEAGVEVIEIEEDIIS